VHACRKTHPASVRLRSSERRPAAGQVPDFGTRMPPPTERRLGSNGPMVPCLGFGAAWVTKIPDTQALGAVEAAWAKGTRYFDTAPWYGKGLSEHRLGLALHDKPRGEYHISTKVGRTLRPVRPSEHEEHGWLDSNLFNVEFDYSWEGVTAQHQASLQRLGCGTVDVLVIHEIMTWRSGYGMEQYNIII
jgi:D-threo-aldose 1-dehydrogenase